MLRSSLQAVVGTGDDNTDAARIRAIGGPRADVYGEMTHAGLRTMGQAIGLSTTDRFLDLGSVGATGADRFWRRQEYGD